MQLTDFLFLFAFLPLGLGLDAILRHRGRGRNTALLALSLVFCAASSLAGLVAGLLECALVFLLASFLARAKTARAKKRWCAAGCAGVIALLCYFKYTNFLRGAVGLSEVSVLPAPVGVSFLSFLLLSYYLDVYHGRAVAETRFDRFLLYALFFPKAAQGPLCRYDDFTAQLDTRSVSQDGAYEGAVRLILGLGKKALLSSAAGEVAQEVFALAPDALCPALCWTGAVCYAMQIYFDFAGYTDMALGLAQMFGMRLPENFNSPYLAVSVTDFWRRWHMSLSGWFRDFVYIPLGGSRRGRAKQIRNLLIVWALTGLWHGANWTFLCWGLWFFFLLAMEKLWLGAWLKKLPRAVSTLYTFACVCIGWVFFNSPSLSYAEGFLRAMFVRGAQAQSSLAFLRLSVRTYGLQLILCIALCTDMGKHLWVRLGRTAAGELIRMLFLAVVLSLSILSLTASNMQAFIYAQF